MTWKSASSGLFLLMGKAKLTSCRQTFAVVLASLLSYACFSQASTGNLTQNNYRAVFWTSNEGLSLPKKNVMLKDINGFLWIISPVGLNRFDGSTFKIYYPDKTRSGTIGGSYTFSMVEDSLHNIWIGTNKGLSRYDIKTDTFKNFSPDTISITSLATVMPFWATRNEIFCLEAGYKIVTFDVHSFRKNVLLTLDKTIQRNNINVPNSIYDSNSNSVWMLTGEFNSPTGGLMQVSLSDKKIVHYKWPCAHQNEKHSHYSYNMQYDKKRNCIWINTVDGLFSFSLKDNRFTPVSSCSDFMPLMNYEIISGLEIDLEGKLWLFTNSKGIVVYDPEKKTVSPLFSEPLLQKQISDDNMSIYADRDGMVWCGYLSGKGVCQLIPFTSSTTRVRFAGVQSQNKTFSPYTNIIEADTNELWVGKTDGELYS